MKKIYILLFALFISVVPTNANDQRYTVNTKNVKIYESPSLESKSQAIPKNTSVIKLDEKDRFYMVEWNGNKGWVLKVFLSIEKSKDRDFKRKSIDVGSESGSARGLLDDLKNKLDKLDE